jgi:hypothetical protein
MLPTFVGCGGGVGAVMLMSRPLVWATFKPGTLRKRSPKSSAGAVAISAAEITVTEAGAVASVCSVRPAVTTTVSKLTRSSGTASWARAAPIAFIPAATTASDRQDDEPKRAMRYSLLVGPTAL